MNTHLNPIYAWMNCYGPWDPRLRHPIETIGYDQYLSSFVSALSPFRGHIAGITISGGMRDALGRTECETTKPELDRRLREAGLTGIAIETDEASLTSMSIARSFCALVKARSHEVIPLLFVDAVRYESNLFTVEQFCRELSCAITDARQLVAPLPRLDCHPNSAPEFQARKLQLMKERGIEEVEQSENASRKSS